MSSKKSLILFGDLSQPIRKKDKYYLNIIPEEIAFLIFLYIDLDSDLIKSDSYDYVQGVSMLWLNLLVTSLNNLIVFDPFKKVIMNPYSWVNKLCINYPLLNKKFVELYAGFSSYSFVNVEVYRKLVCNISANELFKIVKPTGLIAKSQLDFFGIKFDLCKNHYTISLKTEIVDNKYNLIIICYLGFHGNQLVKLENVTMSDIFTMKVFMD